MAQSETTTDTPPASMGTSVTMTHPQIMKALSGLMLGMFVAILSSTIVSNALPQIISDLGGTQSSYTWVVTAALLSMTAATPLWGKLSDLFSKKLLVQISLVIYVLGSVVAGLSQNTGTLIACRVVQGIGVGGLSALAQIVMAAMISPRERGRYSGYLGAVFAVATVGGPLLGGVITDTEWLGWRWCFYVGVPFAIIALIVLQRTLHLPVVRRDVKVDWLGAFLISGAVSLLLIWVTQAGDSYEWISWQTWAMTGGALVLGLLFLLVESRASDPIIPLRLFRNKTISLASAASLFVGIAMFSGTVFFSQFFQLARGESPTMSGILTIPMIAGLFVSSTLSGQVITKTGKWKAWLVSGGVLLTAGLGLLGTLRYDTPYWHIAIYMAVTGLGLGMMMQNLVLATQNQVAPRTWERPARSSPSSAPSAAPWASPHWAPSWPTGSPTTSRTASPPSVRRPRPWATAAPPGAGSPTWTSCPRRSARSSSPRTGTASATSSSTPPRSRCSDWCWWCSSRRSP